MTELFIADTETTGVNARKADILSLGAHYLRINDSNKIIEYTPMQYFFAQDYEVPSEASRITNLTRSSLLTLSKGLYFEDSYNLLSKYFNNENIILVGYNTVFDKTIIESNCERTNVPKPVWKKSLDVMRLVAPFCKTNRYGTTKLVDAVYQYLIRDGSYTQEKIDGMYNQMCGHIPSSGNAHDALYDSFLTMLLLLKLIKKGALVL